MMVQERVNDPGYEGLKILAKMIARIHLEERAQERLQKHLSIKNEEGNNAHQRNQRSHHVAPVG